ncbi:MAG: MFS transporter [Actinomycetota bacterium]|nr:MFS transporter [Actinomycetota bacterium]
MITPVFLLIMLSTFAYFVSVGSLIPILPRYVEGPLDGGNVAVGVAIGAFAITAVLLRPIAGRVSDERGRRILIVSGGVLVGLTTLGLVVVDTLAPLIVLRVLTGIGEAFFYVGAASTINDLAPDHRRGEALSLFSLSLYAGLAVGPVLGELVLEGTNSFGTVWVVSAVSALVSGVACIRVPDTRLGEAPNGGPRRVIARVALLPGIALATSVWGMSGFNGFVPLYALELGLDGSRVAFLIFSVVVLLLRLLGARIPDKLGHLRTARMALSVSVSGLTVIGLWQSVAGLYVGAAIFALGQALIFPSLMSYVVSRAAPSERGSVVGTFTAFFDLAFGLGAVSLGAVSEALGYSGLFLSAAAVAGAGLAMLVRLDRRAAIGRSAPPSAPPDLAAQVGTVNLQEETWRP